MKRATRIERMSVEEALAEHVRLGYLEVCGVDDKGDPLYRLTPAGEQHVRDLLGEQDGPT